MVHEVIVPSVTFVATPNIVYHNKMTPMLVDVDPLTYNLSPDELGKRLECYEEKPPYDQRIRAAIPVHLFGQPAAMDDIKERLPEGTFIIEDSCECVGAHYKGKPVGSLGDVGVFSLYVAHIITAGVGGIATTNDQELAEVMRSLVNHGRDPRAGGDIDIEANDWVRGARFKFNRIGHSFRITELEAAIALAQLDSLDWNLQRRQENAEQLTKGLKPFKERLQLPTLDPFISTHSFMMYPIVYHGDKWRLCGWLESIGIETREMLPLTNQPAYVHQVGNFPNAKYINEHGFYIGCHPWVTDEDIRYVTEAFDEYFSGGGGYG
jgi:dTDP-4-amino-4,6-dideoxygalactose transaminase